MSNEQHWTGIGSKFWNWYFITPLYQNGKYQSVDQWSTWTHQDLGRILKDPKEPRRKYNSNKLLFKFDSLVDIDLLLINEGNWGTKFFGRILWKPSKKSKRKTWISMFLLIWNYKHNLKVQISCIPWHCMLDIDLVLINEGKESTKFFGRILWKPSKESKRKTWI